MLAAFSVGSMAIQPALGKDFPTKSVEIVVPFASGSPQDIMSRLVAETAPKYLGQPIVVVNKPGAGGSIAAADVISSKPDGYKLYCGINNFFALTTKTQKIPFDASHLIPLVNFIEYKSGMCVSGSSPWKNLNDLLDYGRKNPGKLRWGHSGRGIKEHIVGSLIFRKAGVEAIDIPYPGGVPQKTAALLGGHIDASAMTYGTVKDLVRAGKMRFLLVIRDQRYSDPSDVPSAAELGFPEVGRLLTCSGFFIHKDTPEEIKKTLFDVFKKIYDDPEFSKKFKELGDEPRFGGPEFLAETIRRSEELGVPMLKELGLYVAN